MPNKEQLEKEAWEWAETVELNHISQEHIEKVYRVKLKPCRSSSCRKNCRGNPHCISGLGVKPWMQTLDYNAQDIEDPNSERRKNSFVGLKNLGATCYVNSYLQVWYHNPAFRKAVYDWRPDEPEGDISSESILSSIREGSTSYIRQLQLIFALLQFSNRRYIDPSPFISALGLNTNQQQDAQEFSNLFQQNLEQKLSTQANSSVKDVVQELYCGELSYRTRCSYCSSETTQQSKFYELDLNIRGHKDLFGCLEEFLMEEQLCGPNQYFCGFCQCKRDATRRIELIHLPPFLNLQLLRFVFDRPTMRKKKLSSTVHFPEVLDMSRYLNQPVGTVVYDLSAVLIHCGQSAHSGHYVAHIKDRVSGNWYKFNDETVEQMESNKLQLGTEDSYDNGPKTTKSTKLPKGLYGSNCAYMLVYKLQVENNKEYPPDSSYDWNIPEILQNAVLEDNSNFEEWVKDMTDMREKNMAMARERQLEITTIFSKLPAGRGEDFEFLGTDWIIKWLNTEYPTGTEQIPPINHTDFLCPHGKLLPDYVCKVKCISSEAADMIYNKYGGGPRLRNALCRICVEKRCEAIQWKSRIQEEQKMMSTLLKCKISDEEEAYWVGKQSLRSWKKLAMQRYQDDAEMRSDSVSDDNMVNEEQTCNTLERCSIGDKENNNNHDRIPDVEQENSLLYFNEDIVCEHDGLNAHENTRRLVNAAVWKMLVAHFPQAPEFSRNADMCLICQELVAENTRIKNDKCSLAADQKHRLSDLYRDRSRPSYHRIENGRPLYIVGKHFIDEWRKFVKEPQRNEPVTCVMNSTLLCSHGELLYSPDPTEEICPDSCLVLVSDIEWQTIKEIFDVDYEIIVGVIQDEGQEPCITTEPSVCETCLAARRKEEALKELNYRNAKIYVKRVSSLEEVDSEPPYEFASSTNQTEAVCGLEEDPDFVQTVKKQKIEGGTGSSIHLDSQLRRSTRKSSRRTRLRGEKEITVSSTTTLSKLKLQILEVFHVPPSDQNLYLNGKKLSDNNATLNVLNVFPFSVLLLKVDESRDSGDEKGGVPEVGFQGTELMRS